MFVPDDTIVAIATPPGRGGIGVVRISGTAARDVAQSILARQAPLVPRHATFTRIIAPNRQIDRAIDQVIATFFPAPHSYTGEDVVELGAHGSPVLLREIICAATGAGARLAAPGEFTLRAYLRGRIDLVQAEAIADLINAVTPLQARAAFDQLEGTLTSAIAQIHARLFDIEARLEASLDFPEEGYHFESSYAVAEAVEGVVSLIDDLLERADEGRLIREGRQVAIAGKPNVGKSSVFNMLVGSERAIVTAVPGTTRDMVSEVADIAGLPVTLVDTAGITKTEDPVEREGVFRAERAVDVADLVLLILDRSRPLDEEDARLLHLTSRRPRLVAANKIDLPAAWDTADVAVGDESISCICAAAGDLGKLPDHIGEVLGRSESLRDIPALTNVRHVALLERAKAALSQAAGAARVRASEEFVLADIHSAQAALEEMTGRRAPDDLLAHIFQNFCIGK